MNKLNIVSNVLKFTIFLPICILLTIVLILGIPLVWCIMFPAFGLRDANYYIKESLDILKNDLWSLNRDTTND